MNESITVACPYCRTTHETSYPFEYVHYRCRACDKQFTLAYNGGWGARQVVRPEDINQSSIGILIRKEL